MNPITIRHLREADCPLISQAFAAQGWNKPTTQYENYIQDQIAGTRVVLVAEYESNFAGYLTIMWESWYPPFRQKQIPEITDLNVLIKYRRKSIATALMDEAEHLISLKSPEAGIGVGLTGDYGAAQRMYVKRGYLPDGLGISQNEKFLHYGDSVIVDDDLILCLTKQLWESK
jgi:ribosomal protein S18 acetylase RimI-like enzyme